MSKRATLKHLDEVHEGVVDAGTVGQEEATAGTQVVEEEKFLFLCTSEPQILPKTLPIFRWSRFEASSINFLYSVISLVLGKEIP